MEADLRKLWQLFSSIKTAVFLFFLIAATSIIGTIIKQQPTPEGYERIYGATFTKVIKTLELYDMYHSWWFQILLLLFAINLIVCSIDRLPRALRYFKKDSRIQDRDFLQSLPSKCRVKTKAGDIGEVTAKVKEVLEESGFPPKEETATENSVYMFSERGLLNRLGVYITHLSILIILIGGLVGSIFGFTGYMTVVEGGKTNNVILRGGFSNTLLPFEIECKKFQVLFYKNKPNVPKDYISVVSIVENGKEVLTKKIEVNHPLVYKGIYFYQSSYGVYSTDEGMLKLKVKNKKTGEVREISLKVGEEKSIPEFGVRLKLVAFYPDFVLTPSGPTSRSDELNNPAALVELSSSNGTPITRQWVFAFFPNVHQKPSDYEVKFVSFTPVFYTVLQVSRDPGVWLVWLGCILMIAAILLTFFWSHRRVFVWITRKGKDTEVLVGFTANRNQEKFKETAQVICNRIKEKLKGEVGHG